LETRKDGKKGGTGYGEFRPFRLGEQSSRVKKEKQEEKTPGAEKAQRSLEKKAKRVTVTRGQGGPGKGKRITSIFDGKNDQDYSG